MREIMQFKSTKERLKYLSGGFEEVIPVEAKAEEVEEVKRESKTETEKSKTQKKTSKSKKKAKKVEEDGKVQAE